ncbi:MAG: glycosyltransferase family 2 protein, partial [Caulobacteraceae bacterium]|nr:glycosyltransferase family 2 protein [Caulobacteraceae bacterium]
MKIGIGVIAYNVSKELQWLIDSICDKDGKTTNGNEVVLFLHQHSTREKEPEVTAVCESASSLEWVRYTYHGKNRGLSASWNDALVQG